MSNRNFWTIWTHFQTRFIFSRHQCFEITIVSIRNATINDFFIKGEGDFLATVGVNNTSVYMPKCSFLVPGGCLILMYWCSRYLILILNLELFFFKFCIFMNPTVNARRWSKTGNEKPKDSLIKFCWLTYNNKKHQKIVKRYKPYLTRGGLFSPPEAKHP